MCFVSFCSPYRRRPRERNLKNRFSCGRYSKFRLSAIFSRSGRRADVKRILLRLGLKINQKRRQKAMQKPLNTSENASKSIPKSIPEASGTLFRATLAPGGSQNRFRRPPGHAEERQKTILERFSSRTGIQRVSDGPNFAHLAPWGRTIIKEYQVKTTQTQDRTRRWAVGPANF